MRSLKESTYTQAATGSLYFLYMDPPCCKCTALFLYTVLWSDPCAGQPYFYAVEWSMSWPVASPIPMLWNDPCPCQPYSYFLCGNTRSWPALFLYVEYPSPCKPYSYFLCVMSMSWPALFLCGMSMSWLALFLFPMWNVLVLASPILMWNVLVLASPIPILWNNPCPGQPCPVDAPWSN